MLIHHEIVCEESRKKEENVEVDHMRITGGKFKGRTIQPPPKGIAGVRPTMDMVREAVFSMIGSRVEMSGASVLDLFSGSGSFGFESLSRGAEFVQFVEKRRNCVEAIKSTAESLGVSSAIKIVQGDVESFLKDNQRKFTLIFADPPYQTVVLSDFLNLIFKTDTLEENGIVLYECESREIESLSEIMDQIQVEGIKVITTRKYSKSSVVMLTKSSLGGELGGS